MKHACNACAKPICMEHAKFICKNCADLDSNLGYQHQLCRSSADLRNAFYIPAFPMQTIIGKDYRISGKGKVYEQCSVFCSGRDDEDFSSELLGNSPGNFQGSFKNHLRGKRCIEDSPYQPEQR
ncbi:unnamed protein product [Leptidea sinapis]|uniref:Uncharacterized protein n=1 Tax=Leptidea sinapis TaxID=189913 RepID=A0A5E4QXH8_9NEOP|nr:unnamed protein product [Leptidea sinapis]